MKMKRYGAPLARVTAFVAGSLLCTLPLAAAGAAPPAAPRNLRIGTAAPAGAPVCSNGVDDDHDGNADYPNDPECNTPNDGTENVDGDGFPTPETTGWRPTGMTLTAYTGPTNITAAGTVIDGKDLASCLDVNAANVTIRRSWVHCANGDGTWVIHHSGGANLLIEDTEVSSGAPTQPGDPSWCPTCTTRAIFQGTSASMTVRRSYLHNTEAGIAADGGNVLAEYNWIGGNANRTQDNSGQHTTAFKSNGGSSNVVGRYNTLRCETDTNCSFAISFYDAQLVAVLGGVIRPTKRGVTVADDLQLIRAGAVDSEGPCDLEALRGRLVRAVDLDPDDGGPADRLVTRVIPATFPRWTVSLTRSSVDRHTQPPRFDSQSVPDTRAPPVRFVQNK